MLEKWWNIKRKSVWIFAKRGSNSTSQSSKQNFLSQDNSEDQTASQALRTVDRTKKFKEAGKVAHVVWNSPYLLSLPFLVVREPFEETECQE